MDMLKLLATILYGKLREKLQLTVAFWQLN